MSSAGAGRPRASRGWPGLGWNPEVTVAPLSSTTIRMSLPWWTALAMAGIVVWKNDESPKSATARSRIPARTRPSATPTAEPIANLASSRSPTAARQPGSPTSTGSCPSRAAASFSASTIAPNRQPAQKFSRGGRSEDSSAAR